MTKLFGTDGIRGVANRYPMTTQLSVRLGQSAVYVLKNANLRPKMVLGKDTRISSDMLESALMAGITSAGGDVFKVGVLPTPAISYLTRSLNAQAGIVISASHNPFDDNGIKFFGPDGFKLKDEIEEQIEQGLERDFPCPTGDNIGRLIELPDARTRYLDFLKSCLTMKLDLSGKRIVVDGANGATSNIAPFLLEDLGADVKAINCQPDGININRHCGSLHPETAAEEVRKEHAHLGLCFDGDGDRVIAIDENGEIVDGDQIMVICGRYLKSINKLRNNLIVSTVMSNLGFDLALKELGIDMLKTKVGDRYVMEEMKAKEGVLGGEQSGHIIFFEHNNTGDGLLTGLQLLTVLAVENQPLSQLAQVMKRLPQVLINVPVKSKPDIKDIPEIEAVIKRVENKLGSYGRVLVRYSGTEPLARVMIEGPSQDEITQMAQEIAAAIKQKMGA